MSKCGDCGYTLPALDGFPKHVFCKHYKLHMSNKADASRCDYFEKKPITNYDLIRAKSMEEMASKFKEIQFQAARAYGNDDLLLGDELKKYWLDWLRQEVSSDSN